MPTSEDIRMRIVAENAADRAVKQFAASIKNVDRGVGKLGVNMKALGGITAGAFAVQGIRKFNAFLEDSIKLAQTQEDAEKKLETALGRRSQALLDQASALQRVTTYGDETIIGAQALIAAFVKDEDQIKAATAATLDLAAAKGMDLKNAADLVSKTLGSSTNALSRYGITVDGSVGSTERLSSLTAEISRVFGGQAAAAAEVYSGKVDQLSNKYGDLKEQIGFAVMESGAFDTALDHLNPLVDELTTYIVTHKDDIGEFAQALASMAVGTARAAADIGKLLAKLGPLVNLMSSPEAGFVRTLIASGGNFGLSVGLYNRDVAAEERAARMAADAGGRDTRLTFGKRLPGTSKYEVTSSGPPPPTDAADGGESSDGDKYQEQLQQRIEALRKSLMDEKELLDAWRAEQLQLIAEYYGKENDVRTEAGQLRLAIAEEYKNRLDEIEGAPAFVKEIEALQEKNKTEAEIEWEEYQNKLARLEEYRQSSEEINSRYDELRNAVEEDYAKKKQRREQKAEDIIRRMRQQTVQMAVNLLLQFAGKSKAAAIAAIAINKGMMMAQTAQNTAAAAMLAYASQLVPGDPSSVGRAEIARARVNALGAIQLGLIAAAGVGEALSVAGGGGSVGSSSSVTTTSGNTATTTTTGSGEISSRSVTIYGLDPSNLYTGEQIAELLNEYVADGGKIYIK